MRGPKRDISEARKGMYYFGISLMIIGFLSFISSFLSAIRSSSSPMMGPGMGFSLESIALPAIGGIVLILIGSIIMRIGARGAAGSGVILDPNKAREDLEPWSRAAGGMFKDALEETGLKDGREEAQKKLEFDEKLRRLEKLRNEGLITEEEYQAKRKEFLSEDW